MVNLIKVGRKYNAAIREYEIDTASELSDLPTSCVYGSTATDLTTGDVYKFRSSGQWVKLPKLSVHVDIPSAEGEDF